MEPGLAPSPDRRASPMTAVFVDSARIETKN